MKFLFYSKFESDYVFFSFSEIDERNENIENQNDFYYSYGYLLDIDYPKKNIKKRKILLNVRKGVTLSEKKNSTKRDNNNTLLQKYLNISCKTGNKNTLFKHLNLMTENFYFIFNSDFEEFHKYKNYSIFKYLSDHINCYNDFNYILNYSLSNSQSIFDMKTKKNQKKLKLKKPFSHEIVYVPKQKRLKNNLKILNTYSESFKYYNY